MRTHWVVSCIVGWVRWDVCCLEFAVVVGRAVKAADGMIVPFCSVMAVQ